jgi:hypothetical protein
MLERIGDAGGETSEAVTAPETVRFPKAYAAIKWAIVISLTVLAVLAAGFWTLILGGFAASGFHASNPPGDTGDVVITPQCAWPYGVNDHDAYAVCRMFYNLTPERRERVLRQRK